MEYHHFSECKCHPYLRIPHTLYYEQVKKEFVQMAMANVNAVKLISDTTSQWKSLSQKCKINFRKCCHSADCKGPCFVCHIMGYINSMECARNLREAMTSVDMLMHYSNKLKEEENRTWPDTVPVHDDLDLMGSYEEDETYDEVEWLMPQNYNQMMTKYNIKDENIEDLEDTSESAYLLPPPEYRNQPYCTDDYSDV